MTTQKRATTPASSYVPFCLPTLSLLLTFPIQESVFYIGESLSVVFCARLSDRYGRRPILLLGLLGLLGLSVSILSFGSAPSFYLLVISRFFQGCFNGSLGIAKTVLNEVTDEGNRARAFRAIPLTWTVGAAVGCAYASIVLYFKHAHEELV